MLIWVQKTDEPELQAVFQQAIAIMQLSPEGRARADRHRFETLVGLHRAGEGAPFVRELRGGINKAFARVQAARQYDPSDVTAGREYVKAYIEYIRDCTTRWSSPWADTTRNRNRVRFDELAGRALSWPHERR